MVGQPHWASKCTNIDCHITVPSVHQEMVEIGSTQLKTKEVNRYGSLWQTRIQCIQVMKTVYPNVGPECHFYGRQWRSEWVGWVDNVQGPRSQRGPPRERKKVKGRKEKEKKKRNLSKIPRQGHPTRYIPI